MNEGHVKIYCIWSIDEDHSINLFLCTLDSNCKIIMHLQISFIVFDSFWFGLGFFFFIYVTEVKKDSHVWEFRKKLWLTMIALILWHKSPFNCFYTWLYIYKYIYLLLRTIVFFAFFWQWLWAWIISKTVQTL